MSTLNAPGVCIDQGNGYFGWSPIKISEQAVDISEDEIDLSDCVMLEYQPKDGVAT